MVPLAGNTEAVVNATVVTPAASVSDAPVTCPPMAGDALGALITSALVCTVTPVATDSLGAPVVSCPAANVMRCDPAGSAWLAVVHTIVRFATVIVHTPPAKDAEPDTGVREPAGDAAPVK